MKRSAHLRLTLMAASLPAALTACDSSTPTGEVVASLSDCDKVTDISPAECRAEYAKALEEHQRIAPRFDSESQCAAQFGHCNPTGLGSFIPPMSGFLLGYAASSLLNSSQCDRYPDRPGCRSNNGGYRQVLTRSPLYRDYRSGGYVRPDGGTIADRPGQVFDRSATKPPPARAIAVSRSGFGSSSAARSSFGSRSFGG